MPYTSPFRLNLHHYSISTAALGTFEASLPYSLTALHLSVYLFHVLTGYVIDRGYITPYDRRTFDALELASERFDRDIKALEAIGAEWVISREGFATNLVRMFAISHEDAASIADAIMKLRDETTDTSETHAQSHSIAA